MFGYVTVCKNQLSPAGLDTFKSYYCGLCRETGKRCSQSSRLGLSYDITFLAIMLSSLEENAGVRKNRRCILHPSRVNQCVEEDKALSYAADMGVILSYLKLLDDWRDDRSVKSLFAMLFFYGGVRRARKRYPKTYADIRGCLDSLSALENENCPYIDKTADCFAKILKILFTPDFIGDETARRSLSWLGYNIGRWIYIIDAYSDLEKDMKRKSYNTFAASNKGKTAREIKETLRGQLEVSLTFALENAASAYNLLSIRSNGEVLDNIIYTALKMKQKSILGEKNESL